MFRGILLVLAFFAVHPLSSKAQEVPSFGLLREVWTGIGGGVSVSDLTSSPNYPSRPSSANYVTDLFEAPIDVLEEYGQRLHGYLVPPLTGDYTFWISSDDGGALYLSSDEDPAKATRIARVDGWTSPREWNRESNQRSAPIRLTAGNAYYISALMKEGYGGDNLAVRWRLPDGTDQAPIVATNLLPWGVDFSPPLIAQQPTNTVAVEGSLARFRVVLSTVGPAAYQWRRDGVIINDARQRELVFGPVRLSDHGARFSVVITNGLGSVTSASALLSVTPDVTPPAVKAVLNISSNLLRVTFTEPVSAVIVTNVTHYQVTPARAVESARLGSTPDVVELRVAPLTFDARYNLTVSGVQDLAQTPNMIVAGSQFEFTALEYTDTAVGTPPLAGEVTPVRRGANITGSGEIGGTSDAFNFACQWVSGDFDRKVRVAYFSPSDPFATAGLMARATLLSNSVFAAAVSTPAQVGSFFISRTSAVEEVARSGSFPANFPETWLRLSRAGNLFRGFGSLDGESWVELGRATIIMPSEIYLGFSVASHDSGRVATAQFRDSADVTSPVVGTIPARRGETLGPSSRHTPLVISEIMYHPRERTDARNLEYIELYNADLIDQDLTGHRLSGSVSYEFPDGYSLPAGGFVVIARVPADLGSVYGLTGILGPFTGATGLPNDLGTVQLLNPQGTVLLEIAYDTQPPWPVAADGGGHSLVLRQPSYGEGDVRAWAASDLVGGSPGGAETIRPHPQATIRINEILAHTDLPQLDLIELYNHSNDPVDLGGCLLADNTSMEGFRIPPGTTIAPRGFIAFEETQLGFRLDAAGETVFLLNSNLTRVLDAVRFGPQENGVSSGRYPDGTPEWRRLSSVTPGAENAPFRVSSVVINELLYSPITHEEDEFIELYNRSTQPVDLSDWSFVDGITFRFPRGTVLPAGGYFVVTHDRQRFLQANPGLPAGNVFGDFDGNLSNGGERVALAMPDLIVSTNALGLLETNRVDIVVDDVIYDTGGRWATWSDGLGSSLELIDANSDHLQPSNWADSDESGKAAWTQIEFTGRVDNVADGVSTDRLHLVAEGPGEYLIDDIQVLAADGSSRLANGDFSGGLTGWTRQGNHRDSSLSENEGVGGSRALRIVATGRGDTAVNRVRASLTSPLPSSATATIRAKVRWLRGWPEFLLRTRGSGIEAFGRLELPAQAGTPGARNSRAVSNAGPAIFDVRHSPVVPRDREAVVVTARVTDPDGLDSVVLRYRVDPASTSTALTMRDDGTGGDRIAGDGEYSATISGRSAGTLVAFIVRATDRNATTAVTEFPAIGSRREALIHWGEQPTFGNLGTYRFWQRKSDYDRLRSREPLANDPLDCTFIHGDERIIYNADMRAKGSPWHGGSVGADYVFNMPPDDRLLGARDVAVVTVGNLGNDPSAQREQAAFWIGRQLGIPALHRRHVQFFENGAPRGLYEDTEEPNGTYTDAWFPEGQDGDLYKIEDWFEFNDAGDSFVFSRDATLERFTTTGSELKLARYRWAWRKRAVVESANDYSNFFNLVQTINGSGTQYATQLQNVVDMDIWMRVFAMQHIVGNWDAYGYGRGKNSYLYLPTGGRWQIIPWDIDFVLGSGSDGPTTDVFGSVDPLISKVWSVPVFERTYWRAFQDAVRGPLQDAAIGPVLDGRYEALVANGWKVEGTEAIKSYVRGRREYLANRIAQIDVSALDITSNNGASFSTNRSTVILSGRAPIAAATLAVNGVPFPVQWTSVSSWTMNIPLAAATNVLRVVGLDRRGQPIPGLDDSIIVRYSGPLPGPEGFVVIHEIAYDPPGNGAGFVEVFNRSATSAFDLSGWRLEGVDFVFPLGTLLPPGGFAVVAADLAAFRLAYGSTIVPVGQFAGRLQNDGETLRLAKPGATPDLDRIIDEVRYEGELPWPPQAHGDGPSVQLIDASQDNRRPANWGAAPVDSSTLATPGRANSVATTLDPFPTLWINEVAPPSTGGRTDGAGDSDPWMELYNDGSEPVDLSGLYLTSTYTNLTLWAFPQGTAIGPRHFLSIWCDGEPAETSAGELHTNFRLPPTNGVVALVRMQAGTPVVLDHLPYRNLTPGKAWGSFPDGDPLRRQVFHFPTFEAPNNPSAPSTLVFINEWLALNEGAVLDPADQEPDDWFELYNAGDASADLSGYTLTDDPSNPDKYLIPNGTMLPPGGLLLVWADEEDEQATNGQLHVNFRLSGSGETVALYAPDGAQVDLVTFGAQSVNIAQGRFPDGGAAPFVAMDFPTPGDLNAFATANQPPSLAALSDQTVIEGATISFRATATDPDTTQQLRFSLVGAPTNAALDAVTGQFTWMTSERDGPGVYGFGVRVTDNGQPPRSHTRTLTLTVREQNQAPILEPIADRTIPEGQLLSFEVSASDADEPPQHLTYALEAGAPAGTAVHHGTGMFTWIPSEAQGPGTYVIGVRVTDSETPGLMASRNFTLTVQEVDNAPVFDLVGLQTVEEGTAFVLNLVARDPDTPPKALTYSLDSAPAGAVINASSGQFSWTPEEAAGPGSYTVIVRATQAGGGPEGTLSFSVVVNEKNEPPVVTAIPDVDEEEGETIRFTIQAIDRDSPAQRLTYRLEPGTPPDATVDPQSGEFLWLIADDNRAQTNIITVRVTDDAIPAASTTARFTVRIHPRVRIVINEIHYAPVAPLTEFVELWNPSKVTPWALGGWRLSGLNFTFPTGFILEPEQYVTIARNSAALRAAFPTATNVVGNAELAFPDSGADRVRLERPRDSGWEVVDEVSFLRSAPWPDIAATPGASLQLIDPTQDNRRVLNWAAVSGSTTNPPRNVMTFTNSWRYRQDGPAAADWKSPAFSDADWLAGRGLLYVEEAALPAPKNTPMVRTEGRMTYYFRGRFVFEGNPDGASLVLRTVLDDACVLYLNGQEIFRLGINAGVVVNDGTAADRVVSDATLEGPFNIPATNLVVGENVLAAEVHQNNGTSSDLVWGASVDVLEVKRDLATPGYANSVRRSLPPIPDLWISKVLPRNTSGIVDNVGDRDPWLEIHNAGSGIVDLSGQGLTDNLGMPMRWTFPNGASIGPGAFAIIWADGEVSEATAGSWHTGFSLAYPRGFVALMRNQNGTPAVLDYVNYDVSAADQSYGILDSQNPVLHGLLPAPSPGRSNQPDSQNRPPSLETIGNRAVIVGNTLTVDLKATDPDVGQILRFSLATPVPAGAAMDASSGRFTWTPTGSQVGNNTVKVVVTDNGQPPLTDEQSFVVTVTSSEAGEVRIIGISLEQGNTVRLRWSSAVGKSYRVEEAAAVEGGWTTLGSPVVGAGATAEFQAERRATERFYRVVRLD